MLNHSDVVSAGGPIGRARRPHPARRAGRTAAALVAGLLAATPAAGAGADAANAGSRWGPVPRELVGTWRFDYASDIGYTNQTTGVYTPGRTQISTKTFEADGRFRFSFLERVVVEQCWTTISREWSGTVTVQNGRYTLHPATAMEKGYGSCGARPYTKRLSAQADSSDWRIDVQASPRALWVKGPQESDWHGPFALQPTR